MNTEITNKSEVDTIKNKFSTDVNNTRTYVDTTNSTLSNIDSYEDFNLSAAANIISSNLNTVVTDLETISKNISSYIDNLFLIDQDTNEIETVDQNEFKDISTPSVPSPSTTRFNNTSSNNTSNNTNRSRTNPLTQTYSRSSSRSSSSNISYATGAVTASTARHLTNPSSSNSSNNTTNIHSNNKSNFNTTPATNKGDSNIDISKYRNRPEAGFQVTTGNLAYDLSDADIDLLCAIVAAESDKSYDDALAVITTILNRCEAPNWVASHGTNPVSQATAPNQFVVYQHGSYRRYINGNAPDTVKQAVADALAGVRNHNYLSFRSNGSTGYSNNMITSSGNRYK